MSADECQCNHFNSSLKAEVKFYFTCYRLQDFVAEIRGRTRSGRKMRKPRKTGTGYLLFFCSGGDGLVILKGFEGMFAHPLNGLKRLEASIFLSARFKGEGKPGWSGPIGPRD